jgi:hypothetical protein
MTGTGAFSITGSATNVTGTTNASLATLSALSLPYSQLSGTNPSLPTVGGALTGALASSSTARFTEIGAGMSTTPGFILEVQPSGLATHPIVLENSALTEPLYWVMVDASGGGDPQVMNASGIVTIDTDGTTGAVRAYSFGGEGSAATFAAGAAAGTSPGTPACTTSHVCDSFSGVISFTTGTSTAIGVLLTVTTGITRTNQPNCHGDAYLVASPYTALSARLTYSTTTIVFSAGTAPTASTAYELVYSGCGGY